MKLNKYKLGSLIKQRREKNNNYNVPIKGVSKEGFIDPKQKDADTKLYNVFYKNDFVFNPARMELNSIALNTEIEKGICSSLYEIFYIKRKDIILPEYLNLFIKRDEFARHCEFIGLGSAREYCRIRDISEIIMEVPDIEIQQKYIDIYKTMADNQKSYEKGLEDLKLVCDEYIDSQISKDNYHKLGNYIKLNHKRNNDGRYCEKNIMGFNDVGDFIKPMRVFSGDINKFRIISKGDFVYNPRIPTVTFPIALNNSDNSLLVSPAYVTFNIKNNKELLEDYLIMILQRKTFSRKVLFNTWGSSTPYLRHEDLCDVKIPIPSVEVQKSLAQIYKSYNSRRIMNENLKQKLKEICPILIKGSLEEAKLS